MKKQIKVFGIKWSSPFEWGHFHPESLHQWFNPMMVTTEGGELKLRTAYSPRSFYVPKKGRIYLIPQSTAVVVSEDTFGFGTYEADINLPQGTPMAWPAFWLVSKGNWPPEVDIFEGYSNKRASYFKLRWKWPWEWWNIQSNFHYEDPNRGHKMVGSKNAWLGFKNPTKKTMNFKCVISRQAITIYWNDRLVDHQIGTQVQKDIYRAAWTKNIQVIFDFFLQKDIGYHTSEPMVVRSFKFTPEP
jgi:hypothetical protein